MYILHIHMYNYILQHLYHQTSAYVQHISSNRLLFYTKFYIVRTDRVKRTGLTEINFFFFFLFIQPFQHFVLSLVRYSIPTKRIYNSGRIVALFTRHVPRYLDTNTSIVRNDKGRGNIAKRKEKKNEKRGKIPCTLTRIR